MLPKDIHCRTPWSSRLKQLQQIFSHGCRVNIHSLSDLPSVSAEFFGKTSWYKKNKRNLMNPQKIRKWWLKKKTIGESRFVHIFPLLFATHQPHCQLHDHHLQLQRWKQCWKNHKEYTFGAVKDWESYKKLTKHTPKKLPSKWSRAVYLSFQWLQDFLRTQRTSYRVWCCTIAWLLTCEGWSQTSEVIVSWALLGATGPH